MKVLHTISSLDLMQGGPTSSVQLLANELSKNILLSVATLKPQNAPAFLPEVDLSFYPASFPFFQAYSNQLKQYLFRKETDLLHGHGLWQYPEHIMAQAAKKRNIPYVLSPRGQLLPWAMKAKQWKKKSAMFLYARKDLTGASCIHATAAMEAEAIRDLGFTNPIAIIPNGIKLSEYPERTNFENKNKKKLLFLSRIHVKKGLTFLIEAWSQLDISLRRDWQLEIVGNGEHGFIASLQKTINDMGMKNEIHISGPRFGSEKFVAYQQADLFVLPTLSENFGNVVLEALACGVPVITTKGAPWAELEKYHAGWWIELNTRNLAETLDSALSLSNSERREMGTNGRQLAEKNYGIQAVSEKMIRLYEWLLGNGEQPDFIV